MIRYSRLNFSLMATTLLLILNAIAGLARADDRAVIACIEWDPSQALVENDIQSLSCALLGGISDFSAHFQLLSVDDPEFGIEAVWEDAEFDWEIDPSSHYINDLHPAGHSLSDEADLTIFGANTESGTSQIYTLSCDAHGTWGHASVGETHYYTIYLSYQSVVFSKPLVVTGYSVDGTGSSAGSTVHRSITATVYPYNMASSITFEVDNSAEAYVTVTAANNSTGIVSLDIYGVDSTQTSGAPDAALTAYDDSNPVADVPVLVVKPAFHTRSMGPVNHSNTYVPIVFPGGATISSEIYSIQCITVLDQFGNTLDTVYDGDDKVTETFSATTGNAGFFANGFIGHTFTIIYPNNHFVGGVKDDKCGTNFPIVVGWTLNGGDQLTWQLGGAITQAGNTFDNTIQFAYQQTLPGPVAHSEAFQSIQVHGHPVPFLSGGNTYSYVKRICTESNAAASSGAFTTTDEHP